jgi:hypothetical protein
MSGVRALLRWLGQPLNLLMTLLSLVPLTVLFRYMWFEGRNVPRFDQWRGFPVVYAVDDGTLTLAHLFAPTGDQMTFFAHLQAAIFTWLTDWNLWAEMWVNLVVGIIAFLVYVMLFMRTQREAVVWVLVPFSLLIFMLRQDANWTNGYMSQWWGAQVWWLLALWTLAVHPGKVWAALLAGLLGFFATISQAVGSVTWPAVLLYLLLRRERSMTQISIWVLAGLASVAFYTLNTPASVENASEGGVGVLFQAVIYALAQAGTVFEAWESLPFLVMVGSVGLVLLLTNAAYLFCIDGEREAVVFWGSIAAYGFAAGYLIGVGRIPEDGFERVFFTWYTTAVLPFWLALVALGVTVSYRVWRGNRTGQVARGLLYANISVAALLGMLYTPSNDVGLNKLLATQWRSVQERCIMQYIFVQGDIAFCYLQDTEQYQYNQLAARRLALYADRQPESILHPGATDSDPILVAAHTPWLNTHIRDYFLDGVDHSRIYHLHPDMPDVTAQIPTPLEQTFTDASHSGVNALLETFGVLDAFWYIRRVDHKTEVSAFWEIMRQRGYFVLDTRERNDGMLVSRVQFVPDNLENSPRFGDNIRLRAVTDVSETVSPCDTINVSSFWAAAGDIPLDYSGSLRLLNANGEKVGQSDAGLGVLGSSQWQPGELYADERTLAVPCELPPGNYRLTLGVYYYQAPGEFLVTSQADEGDIEPNTVLLREIIVE